MTLYLKRYKAILELIKKADLLNVLDMGCGDGKLVKYLIDNKTELKIIGIDNSDKSVRKAIKNNYGNSVKFINQSFLIFNSAFKHIEIIILSEVIEHLNFNELNKLFHVVFELYEPQLLIITTPNRSYNHNYKILYNGLRQNSHLFELSDDDIPKLLNYFNTYFPNYVFVHKYCDDERASHLIIAERSVKDEI